MSNAVYEMVVNFAFEHEVFGWVGPHTSKEARLISPFNTRFYKRPIVSQICIILVYKHNHIRKIIIMIHVLRSSV